MDPGGSWDVHRVGAADDRLGALRQLVHEYVLLPDAWSATGGVPAALPAAFATEIADLPGRASPPLGSAVVAEGAGRTLGCGLLVPLDEGRAELKRVYVRTEGRGRGVGRSIVTALLHDAGAFGYRAVALDVMGSRLDAVRLYETLGFRPTEPYRHHAHHAMTFLARDV